MLVCLGENWSKKNKNMITENVPVETRLVSTACRFSDEEENQER